MGLSVDDAEETFSGVIADQFVFNFRYWSYEQDKIVIFENTIIEYFTSDSARLIAPIKSVALTANNGTTYFIVQDGSVSLDGFPSILLSSGATYGAGQS